MARFDANPDLDTTFYFDADPEPDPTLSLTHAGKKSEICFRFFSQQS
jgi:hypothetical protein